jgi:spore maturation protein SpmB
MIITSGKIGIDLSLYLILPIMVIMMAIMKVLDEKRILIWVARIFSPFLIIFGLPGIGVLAILQILFISFAAPVATLKLMEKDPGISDAKISATLAAVLVMAQANAAFPLVAVGLNLPISLCTSILFGLLASFIAFKICKKSDFHDAQEIEANKLTPRSPSSERIITLLFKGGEEGLQIVWKSIPTLIIAVFIVQVLDHLGVVVILERLMTPFLTMIGIPGIAVLPIFTKFIAGGTASMAMLMDLMNSQSLSIAELNRITGFTLNPLDPVGLALFMATGPRVAKVARPAVLAAIVGILLRGICHLFLF